MDEKQVIIQEKDELTKKSPAKGILIGILLFVALVAAVSGVLFMTVFKPTPKKVFDSTINNVFTFFTDNLDEKAGIKAGEGSISFELKSDKEEMKETLNKLNGIALNYSYEIDGAAEVANFSLDATYDKQELLSLITYLQDEKMYAKFPGLLDDTIYTDIEDAEEKEYDMKDFKVIMDSINTSLKKSIKKEYLERGDETVSVNGKDVKVTANSLKLDKEKSHDISKDFLTNLEKDSTFVSTTAKVLEKTDDEVKKMIEDSLLKLNTSENENESESTIIIYTKGITDKFVGFEVVSNKDSVRVIEDKEDSYTITTVTDGKEVLTGKLAVTAKGSNTKTVLSLKVPEGLEVTITFDHNEQKKDKVSKADVSNAKNYQEYTVDENTVMTRLLEKPGVKKLQENFPELFASIGNNGLVEDKIYNTPDVLTEVEAQ